MGQARAAKGSKPLAREGRAYWRDMVARWRRSAETVASFCRREGLRQSTFQWWKWRLRADRDDAEGAVRPLFLPVRIQKDQEAEMLAATGVARTAGVEIVAFDGHVIRVGAGFDRQVLADVLEVLESR